MRVRIQHKIRYGYDGATSFGPHLIRLRPAPHARATVLSYNLALEPAGALHWQLDPWGNHIARLTYPAGHSAEELAVTVDAAFEVRPVNPFDFFVDDRCRELPFVYPDELNSELAPYLATAKPGPRLAAWLADIPATGYITDHLVALNQRVAREVRYILRNEPGTQTSEETLAKGSGSCRDSAVLLCDAFRAQGLAARFVSGYLIQLADEGNIPGEKRGIDHDVVDLHAWCEVFVPGGGWIGLDGTSGLLTNEGHVPLACVVNPELAAAVDGTASRASTAFDFEMSIARIGHEPRPRVPYTDAQWDALRLAGNAVDARLKSAGLRLTMGGEPTWTSREHPHEPDWNGDAMGPTKWSQGLRLARELAQRFDAGTLAMHRMGKQYPGESLPRWVMHLLWRADGVPVWRSPEWQSFTRDDGAKTATSDDARRFGGALAEHLSLRPNLVPAYEDPWAAILREQDLPDDVDPLKHGLDDPEERRTLARVLGRGLGSVVGYALPLQRAPVGAGWTTSDWTFRRRHLFLIPGDSPMGLRLPLERLGGTPSDPFVRDVTTVAEPLGFAPAPRRQGEAAGAGADAAGERARREARGEAHGAGGAASATAEPARGSVRTALCIEPRDGVLHIFLPPMPSAEDFLAVIAAVEDTATGLRLPVRIEGYPPPSDPRLRSCMVTPDPGVLEVNVPVTETFEDYVAMMEKVADAANHAGLTTEKYQLDGREVGSGGGHHLTLGGPTTVQSPFLQRPDLLASVLRYVQNHPSLSYLFTGLFVGPTSQAPRSDEARHDALYELELALTQAQAPRSGDVPPWLTDRLFRNLLVDVAGNTHRAEVCIDKLYDPATLHGRQGLVEFRAYEMPPHERMAAAQMLLMRGLVAAVAHEPYTAPLVRWGSELHDRFMLPHYLWSDLRTVLEDLGHRGVALDEAWYRPFVDYRFPLLGALYIDDVTVELRPALEPWPVLGEEGSPAGTSRYVDSSLERLEVRVDGLTEGRHRVLVNGLALPLRRTGRAGERVAGVRFRAWQPPHCLQPQLGVHHPLRFDVVDTWARRSLGACTHHVWHPSGRGYEKPPLTAYEAAARRAQRFTSVGHLSWPVVPGETTVDPEQPYTLDLRRYPGDHRIVEDPTPK